MQCGEQSRDVEGIGRQGSAVIAERRQQTDFAESREGRVGDMPEMVERGTQQMFLLSDEFQGKSAQHIRTFHWSMEAAAFSTRRLLRWRLGPSSMGTRIPCVCRRVNGT